MQNLSLNLQATFFTRSEAQALGSQHLWPVPILVAIIGFPACTARRFSHRKRCCIKSSFLFVNILAGVWGAAMSPPRYVNLFDLSIVARAVKKLFLSDEFFDVMHMSFPQ